MRNLSFNRTFQFLMFHCVENVLSRHLYDVVLCLFSVTQRQERSTNGTADLVLALSRYSHKPRDTLFVTSFLLCLHLFHAVIFSVDVSMINPATALHHLHPPTL